MMLSLGDVNPYSADSYAGEYATQIQYLQSQAGGSCMTPAAMMLNCAGYGPPLTCAANDQACTAASLDFYNWAAAQGCVPWGSPCTYTAPGATSSAPVCPSGQILSTPCSCGSDPAGYEGICADGVTQCSQGTVPAPTCINLTHGNQGSSVAPMGYQLTSGAAPVTTSGTVATATTPPTTPTVPAATGITNTGTKIASQFQAHPILSRAIQRRGVRGLRGISWRV